MSLTLVRLKAAREDIVEIGSYLAQENVRAAESFLAALDDTLKSLVHMPMMGSVYQLAEGHELRRFWVKGFDKYLIFYQVFDDRIELVRVIHGARDIPTLLEDFDG